MSAKPAACNSPVIVVGMHRSGTSMLTRQLSALGIFVGADCGPNSESAFFYRANLRLLDFAGASWFRPAPMGELLRDSSRRQRLVAWLRRRCCSRKVRAYLGDSGRPQRLNDLAEPWGWKDPRNTLTLSLWLQLFPDAKVIHLVRNGIDVAQSLMDRERREQEDLAQRRVEPWLRKRLRIFSLRFRDVERQEKPPFDNLQQAFSLWCEYLEFGEQTLKSAKPGNLITIRYEDLLDSPNSHLRAIADFLGLTISDTALFDVASGIDRERRFAFLDDHELLDAYQTCRSHRMMKQFGYDSPSFGVQQRG